MSSSQSYENNNNEKKKKPGLWETKPLHIKDVTLETRLLLVCIIIKVHDIMLKSMTQLIWTYYGITTAHGITQKVKT